MSISDERLAEHKALLARMGMSYTEIYGPTDMSDAAVQQRMQECADLAAEVPSVFNAQNDFDLGNQVRMLTRRDSAHEAVVCAARDRIFQLSLQVAALRAAAKVRANSEGDGEVGGPCIPVTYCGLATSTHVPLGSDEDHCDLCGHPAQPYAQAAPAPENEADGLRETMWAEVIYEGEDNSYRFELNEEGNRDGPHYDRSIEFAADTFPAGTKIIVYEPDEEAALASIPATGGEKV